MALVERGEARLGIVYSTDARLGFGVTSTFPNPAQGYAYQEIAAITGEDRTLDSGAHGDGFVRVDALVEVLAIKEVLQELLNLWDSGGSADQDDVVNAGLVHLGVPQGLLNRLQSAPEQVSAELLESGPGDGGVEVNALEQRVDLNVGLSGGGQGSLGPLAGGPQPPDGPLVGGDVLLVLPLELLYC